MTRAVRNTPPVSSLANEGDRTAPAFSPLGSTNGASPGGDPTAFHATAPVTNPLRRGLLVFFDFAPSAEVGALRWISLVGCGAERGWAFDDQHVAVASIRHEGEGDALWDQHIVAGLVD